MTAFVLTFPDINPVAVQIFGIKIRWYALMYILGFIVGYLLLRRRLHHEPFRSIREPRPYAASDIEDVLIYAVAGVLLGGRLGYVLFYKPGYYFHHPLEIVKVWDGGMSFHGGAIGVVLGVAFFAWRAGRPFLQVADFLAPAVPIGLAFGRIGNFINGELWGRPAPADLPWAMIFPTGGDVPRHPSQLYQALLEGLLLFILLWLYARKARYRGQIAAAFFFGYGVFRFIVEFWREPDAYLGFLSGLTLGQWLSLPMVVIGIVLWTWSQRRKVCDVAEPEPEEGSQQDVDNQNGAVHNFVSTPPETGAPAEGAAREDTELSRSSQEPGAPPSTGL